MRVTTPGDETVANRDRCYTVRNDKERRVAEIFMDYAAQVETVLILTKDETERCLTKKLALAHAAAFVRSRTNVAGLLVCKRENHHLTDDDSQELMSFARIPANIAQLSEQEVDAVQKNMNWYEVLNGLHQNTDMLLRRAEEALHKLTGEAITFCDRGANVLGQPLISVHRGKGKFRFWNCAGGYDTTPSKHALYITPPYYPSLTPGRKPAFMINGCTGCNIRGYAIVDVYCPEGKQAQPSFMSGWDNTAHPYYAEGRAFVMRISPIHLRTLAGYRELVAFVHAAMNRKTYVVISGGFRSGYGHPANLLKENEDVEIRGSEGDCVRQYETLEKEGMLKGAIIPPWFHRERWLERYRAARAKHR